MLSLEDHNICWCCRGRLGKLAFFFLFFYLNAKIRLTKSSLDASALQFSCTLTNSSSISEPMFWTIFVQENSKILIPAALASLYPLWRYRLHLDLLHKPFAPAWNHPPSASLTAGFILSLSSSLHFFWLRLPKLCFNLKSYFWSGGTCLTPVSAWDHFTAAAWSFRNIISKDSPN